MLVPRIRFPGILAIAAVSAILTAGTVSAGETVPGPVPAEVLRVIDGDTIEVAAFIWLGQRVRVRVRLEGSDTPELRGQCASERELAQQAKDLVSRYTEGRSVSLYGIHYGKYAGRIVARVQLGGGETLAMLLLSAGLAHEYDGGKRDGWCG